MARKSRGLCFPTSDRYRLEQYRLFWPVSSDELNHSLKKLLSKSDKQISKAMVMSGDMMNHEKTVDTMRLLTGAQSDISSHDIYEFWSLYDGPVSGAEFMFSQGLIQSESDPSDDEIIYPILAAALRGFGRNPPEWENFLRLLLRKRVGLHSPVPRYDPVEVINDARGSVYPCKILEFGTPLDELFQKNETLFEGELAARRWLQILASEGYDVKAYLEEESALHAEKMHLTFPCDG